ncbi:hypothetical protein RSAG8_13340, partial [Rhizoctonia solani AG-8 WAC10335]
MFDSIAAAAFAALLATPASAQWTLSLGGTTGVSAMQMTVATETKVVIFDKYEQNPLRDAMVNIGGNPVVESGGGKAENGLQGVRLYNPCAENENCEIYESPNRIRLTSARWYPSGARLSDGSLLIIGGAYGGGWTNFKELNNPTYEFYPPKNLNGYNGVQIPSQFLVDTLPHNLFPHVFALPNNQIFVAANNKTMMLDWQRNVETRLPDLPNGQRITYPMGGAGVMLPLRWDRNFAAEILMCGGSDVDDRVKETELSAKTTPGSSQCARMTLNDRGIKKVGIACYSGELVLIDGFISPIVRSHRILISRWLASREAPEPMDNIPRMYHSVATLLPSGAIFIAGSNPNEDVTERTYGTEYRAEMLYPDYMSKPRPVITRVPDNFQYNQLNKIIFSMPGDKSKHRRGLLDFLFKKVEVVLMDFGFATHGVHMEHRLVSLLTIPYGKRHIKVQGPPNPNVYPPGPAWLFVIVDGVPSEAMKVMVGDGNSPPVDLGAIENMLANTGNPVPVEALQHA